MTGAFQRRSPARLTPPQRQVRSPGVAESSSGSVPSESAWKGRVTKPIQCRLRYLGLLYVARAGAT